MRKQKNFIYPEVSLRNLSQIRKLRAAKKQRKVLSRQIRDIFLMCLGVFSAGFGLNGFLIPNGFIDGGVMGISLLTNSQQNYIPLSILIVLYNIPFLVLAFRYIGRIFTVKSIMAISLLAIVVAIVPYPVITHDKILIAVFGGFFLGAGIGLTIRGGGVIDGTEILAIHMSRKNNLSVGDFILIFNIVIFSVAAYLLTYEVALYSILTYLAASKTVDFILEGIEEYSGITIISTRSKQIIDLIKNQLKHGLTIYSGRKGFGKTGESNQQIDIIYTVITRLEINRLTTEIQKIDPNAFITMQSIKDTWGGMVKKRSVKGH